MSNDRICTSNVSVVRINGNTIPVGAPSLGSNDVTRFGPRELMFESCKGCVAGYFGTCQFTSIRFMIQVSDILCRMIGFVLLTYPLYG